MKKQPAEGKSAGRFLHIGCISACFGIRAGFVLEFAPRHLRREFAKPCSYFMQVKYVQQGNSASAEAAKGLCDRPLETFAPCGGDSRQVAAALSAAVTISKLIGDAPNIQAEPSKR